ncbi:MAG: glycosyltransferase family 2 protein [Pseudomonadota bacterium]
MTPQVSIVLPCRGRAALLDRAVASVRAQTFCAWELLVIDDASDPPLAPAPDPRLRVIRLARNLGPARAREAGLAQARAPLAAFLDSDDVWRPDKLALQIARLADGPPRALVCGARVEGPGGARLRPSRAARPGERIGAFLYIANEFAQASCVLAPTEAARAAGFGGLRQYEDHYFLLRLAAQGLPVEASAEPLVIHSDDAPDRLGAADDPGDAEAFLAAAEDLLTPSEAQAFRLRCLGPGLARQGAPGALALALGGLRRPDAPKGAAAKLALRALLGDRVYAALRGVAKAGPVAGLRGFRPRALRTS